MSHKKSRAIKSRAIKSRAIKIALIALSFGLIATSPAFAVDLQGSGASFPANLIEGCKAGYAASEIGRAHV